MQVIVKFHEEADRLLIVCQGKVHIEFDHPEIHRHPMRIKEGEYLGDMALLGEKDWAKSTCFHFPPSEDKSGHPTEIRAAACPMSFVVVLQMSTRVFQEILSAAPAAVRVNVNDFHEKWCQNRAALGAADPREQYAMEHLRSWAHIVSLLKKARAHESAARGWSYPSVTN